MARADNSASLLAARRAASSAKRQQVIDAVRAMLDEGITITYNAVAKRARVSAGLVHSPRLKDEIAAAITLQAQTIDQVPRPKPTTKVTEASLLQDLELARAEIRRLRDENKEIRERLQLHLGAQVFALSAEDSLVRIDDLERGNQLLIEENTRVTNERDELAAVVDQLRDELQSSRTAHARLMRQVNAPSPSA